MTTPDKLHDTLDRAIESSAEHTDWLRQLKHEIPEPAPVDECSVLEQAKQIAMDRHSYSTVALLRDLIAEIRSDKLKTSMHAATAARHDQSELSRPKREGVQS